LEVAKKSKVRALLIVICFALFSKLLMLIFSIGSASGFSLPFSEAWQDFSYAYIPTVEAFKSGFLPYKDFFFAYPPLFLYALTAFSYLPLPSWSMALPLVISDAFTVIPVYLIGNEIIGERYSFAASILFSLAPVNLFYADYLWLNPPLTTLFLMASIYLLLKGHNDLSAITLAISIGFKQMSLLALPIILLIVLKKACLKEALRYFLLAAFICLFYSFPYLFIEPKLYLYSVFNIPMSLWPQLPQNYFQLGFTNPSGSGTNITTSYPSWIVSKWTQYVPLNAPMSLSLPLFIFLLPEMSPAVYQNSELLLLVVLIVSYLALLYKTYRNKQIQDRNSIIYVLYALLLLFVFHPVYKYYVVGITPFLALLAQSKRDTLGFAVFNIILLLIPRYFVSYLFLVLLIWALRHKPS
jgi:hypothetical protein